MSKLASHIPESFEITAKMRLWAESNVARLDIDYHTQEFVDHWLANGKAKANWEATWRNWMRRTMDGVFNAKPRMKAVQKQAQAENVHSLSLQRSARTYGIDCTGMTDSQVNQAIWEVQQKARAK